MGDLRNLRSRFALVSLSSRSLFVLFALLGALLPFVVLFMCSWGLLEPLGSLLDAFWLLLGAFWVPLGRLLGASWALLGASWVLLGRSWANPAIFGPIWYHFGSPKGCQNGAPERPKRRQKRVQKSMRKNDRTYALLDSISDPPQPKKY